MIFFPPTNVLPSISTPQPISLAGDWSFQIDRDDRGIAKDWSTHSLDGVIRLPGSMPEQGFGDPITVDTKWTGQIVDQSWFTAPEFKPYRQPGNIKVPFWLQPETYYVGAAWYQKEIHIPAGWANHRVVLSLERPHWQTQVWLDGKAIGSQDSLGTPHEYDLGVLPAKPHLLAIRVDNRMIVDVGSNSHSVTDHTQGNWNGIVGRIDLIPRPLTWIEDLQIYPNVTTRTVVVKANIAGSELGAKSEIVQLLVTDEHGHTVVHHEAPAKIEGKSQTFEYDLPLGADAKLWDEFHPNLYHLSARLASGDTKLIRFGMRQISKNGTHFEVNGHPIFLRGTLECAIFPKTGHPPTDVDSWRRILEIAKSYGLNHLRFHSWCPPEAAFAAADEIGFFYQVEVSSWGAPGDNAELGKWIYAEADRMLKRYGNHPSFMLMPYGNEPLGQHDNEYLAKWVSHYKKSDSRRLYTSGSGWPQLKENDYHVTPDPRIQSWGAGLQSRVNAKPPETRTDYRDYIQARSVPVVSHEIGQWCAYPDFSEIPKYTGYLKARNFEIFRDTLAAHGMSHLAPAFLHVSGRLQTLLYKEEIESALRTPGMGGFQLLDLHDFPGQGTALVGMLNPFWESKGYVNDHEMHRFCGPTVVLARLDSRVFTNEQMLSADIEVSHFGDRKISHTKLAWKLVGDDGLVAKSGEFEIANLPTGKLSRVGRLAVDLHGIASPAHYRLVAGIVGTTIENDWDVWVYPHLISTRLPANVTLWGDIDAALDAAHHGETVVLSLKQSQVKNDPSKPVIFGFSTIFWNTAWTNRQAPTTMGLLVDSVHPLFSGFPTEDHTNWQWWYLIRHATPMILDRWPKALQPIIRVVDDWTTAHKLGLLIEARVGKGKLLISSIDLDEVIATDPVSRQFRAAVLQYAASAAFNPSLILAKSQVRSALVE